RVEAVSLEIPGSAGDDLDASGREVAVDAWRRPAQGRQGLLLVQGAGYGPRAEFPHVQAGLEVRDYRVEQVLLGLVEQAEVAAPGQVAEKAQPAFSQGGHGLPARF